MLVLYDKDQCPFCWRVRMALRRLGLTVEHRAHDDAAWRAVWPEITTHGTVPILLSSNLVLTDSRVILEYLDDRHGGLWPTSAEPRARAREVLCYADSNLGPAARDLIFEYRDKEPDARDPQLIDDAIGRWHAALPALGVLLDENDWFEGECSVADYALATRFGLAFAYQMPMTELPDNLPAWLSRVFARDEVASTAPGVVQQWLANGGLG